MSVANVLFIAQDFSRSVYFIDINSQSLLYSWEWNRTCIIY